MELLKLYIKSVYVVFKRENRIYKNKCLFRRRYNSIRDKISNIIISPCSLLHDIYFETLNDVLILKEA